MSFTRYLDAKRALDDRSLHPRLWAAFSERLGHGGDVLDIGCGLGGMLDRITANVELAGSYTGIDRDVRLLEIASARHRDMPDVSFRAAELNDFANDSRGRRWPVITGHAFLDLVDLDIALNTLTQLLEPDGLVYLSLNYDHLTIVEPSSDTELDDALLDAYHRAMYEHQWGGAGGDPRTGRRLFHRLTERGFDILDMGPSDWIIAPFRGQYRDEDRIVLEYLLAHIADVVRASNVIADDELARWTARRQRQIENAQLLYIAHQLDVLAQRRP
jgi:SAM-dependent methyltransferase